MIKAFEFIMGTAMLIFGYVQIKSGFEAELKQFKIIKFPIWLPYLSPFFTLFMVIIGVFLIVRGLR